jgi:hypothetical protein
MCGKENESVVLCVMCKFGDGAKSADSNALGANDVILQNDATR